MSTARKMRRKLNRALPGADAETVQRTLHAMQVAVEEQTADRIYKKLRRDIQKPSEAYATGVADAFASIIGFLRDGGIGKPFGATRLERFVEQFVAYQDGLHDGKVKSTDINDAIEAEIGWSMTKSIDRAFRALDAKKKGAQKDGH